MDQRQLEEAQGQFKELIAQCESAIKRVAEGERWNLIEPNQGFALEQRLVRFNTALARTNEPQA